MKKLVSIIVPAYNSEKHIKECIDSLVNQTYKNIEIIVVNDGSTDSTVDILKKYRKVKIINQDNKGANIARKTGLKNATGEYVMFVDSDDYISLNTVEILINYLDKYKVDVVHFEQTHDKLDIHNKKEIIMNNKNIKHTLLTSKRFNSLSSAIYKINLFNNIKAFDYKISYAEDYLVNLDVLSKVEKMLIIDEKLYYYRINHESTTKTQNFKRVLLNFDELILVYNKLFNYLDSWKMNSYKDEVSYFILDVTRMYIYNILRIKKLNKKDFISIMNNYLNTNLYKRIRREYNLSDKNLDFIYRIKNYNTLKNIYYKEYDKIYKIKYYLKIKDFLKKII